MSTYFEAPDGHGEPCLWAGDQQSAEFVMRQYGHIPAKFWPDVVARMTGTVITVPDKDALSALCLSFLKPPKYAGGSWTLNPDALAVAILAALTGVPHD